MSDNTEKTSPEAAGQSSKLKEKAEISLSTDSGKNESQILCAPGEHSISDSTSNAAAPLHSPSFAPSPNADVRSSEVNAASSEVSADDAYPFAACLLTINAHILLFSPSRKKVLLSWVT